MTTWGILGSLFFHRNTKAAATYDTIPSEKSPKAVWAKERRPTSKSAGEVGTQSHHEPRHREHNPEGAQTQFFSLRSPKFEARTLFNF